MPGLRKFMYIILAPALIVAAWVFLIKFSGYKNNKMIYGASFNAEYASYLGLDPRVAFVKILDDWQFKYVRLSAQWNLIEKEKGQYDWKDLDWMMNEAAKRNVKVILAVGNKTPRWPECHAPAWVDFTFNRGRDSLYDFIKTTVNHYKNHPALEIWQVENEPFLDFGPCGMINQQDTSIYPKRVVDKSRDLKEELDLVKGLDKNHPTMVTDSGELSLWRHSAKAADLFGTTIYRVVWSKYLGYWSYDWLMPAIAYTAKLWLNGRDINTAYIMELQAEPWIPDKPLADTPLDQQFRSMSLERLKSNVDFAARTGMPRAYLWGAEWWLWLENHNSYDISNYVKQLKKL